MNDDWLTLLNSLSPEQRRAMEFLYSHLPDSDLDCYPPELFLRFADHALMLRESCPWCTELDEDIFNHYVLFPRVNDEDLTFHRRIFCDALWSRIIDLKTIEERVLEVNRWCHETASYEAQDDRTASPLTVFRNGSGRCGEESAFLVSALRSVGIPARQVYVPRWAHCDDNHAWAEALCGGTWCFLGACEPEPVLDLGWFNNASSQAILVHSRLFGEGSSPLHGELISRDGGACWYNQTMRYARVQTCTFHVTLGGACQPKANIYIQVLNESGFHTIASLTSDENGCAGIKLGMGTVHVLAVFKDFEAESDFSGGELFLNLTPVKRQNTDWTEFDFHAPKTEPINSVLLDEQQRACRAYVLAKGNAIRQARTAAFLKGHSTDEQCSDLIQAAKGNAGVISGFLKRDDNPLRETLLRTLTDKDMRDVTEEVLESHLKNASSRKTFPPEIYSHYVLCPRIGLEPLTPWRSELLSAMTEKEQAQWRKNPSLLWDFLKQRADLKPKRTYSGLLWTPYEAWSSGRCDEKSLRILYVAVLRTLGIPARLRPLDGAPELWQNGAFRPVQDEKTGTLHITYEGDSPLIYRQNWTLSLRTDTGWFILTLPNGEDTFTLPAGQYRIITSVRLPNGNQFAARREFTIDEGESQTIPMYFRPYALEDMLCCKDMPVMSAVSLNGEQIPDVCRQTGNAALLLWLDEGGEPTEHVLNELTSMLDDLSALPLDIVILLPSRSSLKHPTISSLSERRSVTILFDDWSYDLEHTARLLTCDPSSPPLAVVCTGKGQAVYGVSGYHVGSVELLTRISAYVCGLKDNKGRDKSHE